MILEMKRIIVIAALITAAQMMLFREKNKRKGIHK